MDSYVIMQLALPARLSEVEEWFGEVRRVLPIDGQEATVTVIEHTDGHARLTVHT